MTTTQTPTQPELRLAGVLLLEALIERLRDHDYVKVAVAVRQTNSLPQHPALLRRGVRPIVRLQQPPGWGALYPGNHAKCRQLLAVIAAVLGIRQRCYAGRLRAGRLPGG
jgi:hypothetical protein